MDDGPPGSEGIGAVLGILLIFVFIIFVSGFMSFNCNCF